MDISILENSVLNFGAEFVLFRTGSQSIPEGDGLFGWSVSGETFLAAAAPAACYTECENDSCATPDNESTQCQDFSYRVCYTCSRQEGKNMDWITGIQNAIDYVEDHLTEELDYEEIAKAKLLLQVPFSADFRNFCGYTLGGVYPQPAVDLGGSGVGDDPCESHRRGL